VDAAWHNVPGRLGWSWSRCVCANHLSYMICRQAVPAARHMLSTAIICYVYSTVLHSLCTPKPAAERPWVYHYRQPGCTSSKVCVC
jgi:hypothetical protein